MAITTTYGVDGMTCEHCVRAVTDELSLLPGVEDVAVELVVGGASHVTVTSARPLAPADVVAALDEAGYVLAPAIDLATDPATGPDPDPS